MLETIFIVVLIGTAAFDYYLFRKTKIDAKDEGWHEGFHEGLRCYYNEHERRFELIKLVRALIEDVKARHPGEELTCPHMKALDANVNAWHVE